MRYAFGARVWRDGRGRAHPLALPCKEYTPALEDEKKNAVVGRPHAGFLEGTPCWSAPYARRFVHAGNQQTPPVTFDFGTFGLRWRHVLIVLLLGWAGRRRGGRITVAGPIHWWWWRCTYLRSLLCHCLRRGASARRPCLWRILHHIRSETLCWVDPRSWGRRGWVYSRSFFALSGRPSIH